MGPPRAPRKGDNPDPLPLHPRYLAEKKEANNVGLLPRKSLAEVHGNRTHLPPYSEGTPDLKSGGPTSEPRTSSGNRRRAFNAFLVFPRGFHSGSHWPDPIRPGHLNIS